MSIISKPNTFSPNTIISSSEVNSNFDTLYNDYNGNISSANLATGAVTTAKIANSAVTADKIANGAVTSSKLANADGWNPDLPAPNTVTNNGNRSYDLVFNGTDITNTVSEGMRLRTTRTVSAPTQCTSLNGSTQYFNRTSPSGMTFTDDFVVSAWVKLTSYTGINVIASRYNGTSGWSLQTVTDTGQPIIVGFNGGAGNNKTVTAFQSIPLNKWVHITAQLDMSAISGAGTGISTTTNYIMIDGVSVPVTTAQAGTNPTALVQAGDLQIGARNGSNNHFNGKIAQVAIYSAKVTQATIQASMSQGLSGSETSLISAYSFNNSINDLSATGNNLTAQNSALATNVDSPFGSYLGGTLDYGIITKTAFSTNTTLTVQVPEGCTIPTSGGVSAVAYSTQAVPYLFPRDSGRWQIKVPFLLASTSTASNATYQPFGSGAWKIAIPIGGWKVSFYAGIWYNTTTNAYFAISDTSLTGLAVADAPKTNAKVGRIVSGSGTMVTSLYLESDTLNYSTSTEWIMYTQGATTAAGIDAATGGAGFSAIPAYL